MIKELESNPFSEEVDSLLRKLYALGMDWLVVEYKGRKWTIHKDRLVSFIGMGLGDRPIKSIIEKKGSLIRDEEDLPEGKILLLDKDGLRISKYSGNDKEEELPPWWSVPLPLVCIKNKGVTPNPKASNCFGRIVLTEKDRKSLASDGELIISREGKRIYLSRMEGDFFLVEDVSGDFSLAEDVGWWAAVGRALFDRLESRGFSVERRERMDQAEDGSELITCSWDKEVLGYLEIRDKENEGLQIEARRDEGR